MFCLEREKLGRRGGGRQRENLTGSMPNTEPDTGPQSPNPKIMT